MTCTLVFRGVGGNQQRPIQRALHPPSVHTNGKARLKLHTRNVALDPQLFGYVGAAFLRCGTQRCPSCNADYAVGGGAVQTITEPIVCATCDVQPKRRAKRCVRHHGNTQTVRKKKAFLWQTIGRMGSQMHATYSVRHCWARARHGLKCTANVNAEARFSFSLPPIRKPSTCCFTRQPYTQTHERKSASRHCRIPRAARHALSAPAQEDHDRLQGVQHLGNAGKGIGIGSPSARQHCPKHSRQNCQTGNNHGGALALTLPPLCACQSH